MKSFTHSVLSKSRKLVESSASQYQQLRYRSSVKGKYQSAEYPWATEPPVITKTTAAEAAAGKAPSNVAVSSSSSSSIFDIFRSDRGEESKETSSANDTSTKTTGPPTKSSSFSFSELITNALGIHDDPFDDRQQLSPERRKSIIEEQNSIHSKMKLSPLLQPIHTKPPTYITSAVSSLLDSNTAATSNASATQITTLPNGIRVVSRDTPGSPVSIIGCVSRLASRSEKAPGVTHLLELLGMPTLPNSADGSSDLEFTMATGREQSLQCVEVWRPRIAEAVQSLGQALSTPLTVTPPEFDTAIHTMQLQLNDPNMLFPPEVLLPEAVNQAAFGTDQQLGKLHLSTTESLETLQLEHAVDHWRTHITENPHGLVLGAVDVDHTEFVQLVDDQLGHLVQSAEPPAVIPSLYRGGRVVVDRPNTVDIETDDSEVARDKRLTRLAVVWQTGGWHADDFVASCVLQSLWGGGSSFSAGGPGKGMYSRLYRTVLNQYHWVESAEAMTQFFDECGLLGIAGSTAPEHARDLIKLFCHHVLWLAKKPVQQEELNRAKSMLRCNVLMQLESRLVSFEDLSRQVLTYGRHEPMSETAQRIEAVTPQDLQDLAVRMLQSPPSLAVVGMDLSNDLPSEEELLQWLRQ